MRKPAEHQKPVFNTRNEATRDKRISTCALCRRGIFEGRDNYIYTNTGYSHVGCLEADETTNAA